MTTPAARASDRTIVTLGSVLVGAFLLLIGTFGGVIYLILPFVLPAHQARDVNVGIGIVAIPSLILGIALLREGRAALRGRPPGPVRLPSVVTLFFLFLGALVLGPGAHRDGRPGALIFPLLTVAVVGLPGLMLLRYVSQRSPRLVSREVTWQLAYGALVATTIAVVSELVLGLAVVAVVLGIAAQTPEGFAWIEHLIQSLASPTWLQDPSALEQVAAHPITLSIMGITALGIGPVVEEIAKGLGAALMSHRRPGRTQAFAWGLAAGVGFALVEGLLGMLMSTSAWGGGAVMRAGATLLHGFTGGLMGLAWYQALVRRHFLGWLGASVLAIGFHAWWNLLAMGLWVTGLVYAGQAVWRKLLTVGLAGILLVTVFLIIVALIAIAQNDTATDQRPSTGSNMP